MNSEAQRKHLTSRVLVWVSGRFDLGLNTRESRTEHVRHCQIRLAVAPSLTVGLQGFADILGN